MRHTITIDYTYIAAALLSIAAIAGVACLYSYYVFSVTPFILLFFFQFTLGFISPATRYLTKKAMSLVYSSNKSEYEKSCINDAVEYLLDYINYSQHLHLYSLIISGALCVVFVGAEYSLMKGAMAILLVYILFVNGFQFGYNLLRFYRTLELFHDAKSLDNKDLVSNTNDIN